MARTVVHAFRNAEAVDPGVLIVNAVSVLEPVHIRALVRLAHAVDLWQQAGMGERTEVMDASRLEKVPVKAALIQTGTVIPATLVGGGVEMFDVSPFGRELLEHLHAAAEEDLERLLEPWDTLEDG